MEKIIIAVDGYSSCGKSTTAQQVAKQMNYIYIDTGAMYRAVTLCFLKNYVSVNNPHEIEKALQNIKINFRKNEQTDHDDVYLNGLNVEDEIRTMRVSDMVSEVSAIPAVRHAMVAQQQRMGKSRGVVMDGRDIGTTVFPDAELKMFMVADKIVRAERRQIELMRRKEMVDLEDIIKNIEKRDRIDTTRAESPLRQATDAILLDTSHITLDEQVQEILNWADAAISRKIKEKENT